MTDIRKIDFTCPECGNKKLYAERVEVIHHPLVDEIDLDEELVMSSDTAGISINDKEYLEESFIREIICSNCGFEVVSTNWFEEYEDPADAMVKWLEEHGMLPAIEKYNCKFCKSSIIGKPQHYHQGNPVCNECWDERLRSTN